MTKQEQDDKWREIYEYTRDLPGNEGVGIESHAFVIYFEKKTHKKAYLEDIRKQFPFVAINGRVIGKVELH